MLYFERDERHFSDALSERYKRQLLHMGHKFLSYTISEIVSNSKPFQKEDFISYLDIKREQKLIQFNIVFWIALRDEIN